MHLAYFDENKYSKEDPFFFIGGILIPATRIVEIENTLTRIHFNFFGSSILTRDTEMHGKELFHAKGAFKGRSLKDRIALLNDIRRFLISFKMPIRLVCIDVEAHRRKYAYPEPEYRWGLTLMLERFCDYLDQIDDQCVVFGDYEKDEMGRSVLDFSQFKFSGRTPLYFGRPLGRLIDTIYFTQSHHSRFLQVADIVVYLANRFENNPAPLLKWHEIEANEIWQSIKKETDFKMQKWP